MISIRGLNKSFGENRVLRNIDLDVPTGGVVVILGPSGSGKSTLLRCINLLEKPQSGEIVLDGQKLDYSAYSKAQALQLRRSSSMVFQGYNLFSHKNALDNVAEGPFTVQNLPREQARQKAMEQLEQVGLSDKATAYPAQLSGGQQQRIAIARALAMNPKVILFDEPTSALDPELVKEVLAVMRDVASRGVTMVVVTHEMEFAREVGTRVVFLDDGQIAEQNTAREFFTNPRHPRAQQFLRQISPDYGYQI